MAVNGISGLESFVSGTKTIGKQVKTEGMDIPFADYLKDAVDSANRLTLESDKLSAEFAAGRTDNIHSVLIAAEKADIALQYTMQVRNKILDAYNEIMRMQI